MPLRPWLTILTCLILCLSGCMKAVERSPTPAPAEGKARFELSGPYDADIPGEFLNLLRGAVATDRRIPGILLAVADHFESEGEEEKALHFLERAAGVSAENHEPFGEALAFCRKVLLLMHDGRENEALILVREGSQKWTSPPLRAFPEYLEGRLALRRGDFIRAREFLGLSLRDNANGTAAALLRLRRDTELAAGMAAVLSDHLPRLLSVYGRPEGAGSERPLAGQGGLHLQRAIALNGELHRARDGSFIPASDFQRCEAETYAFLGLDEGMKGNAKEALRYLTDAAALSRAGGLHENEIRSLLFLGELGSGGENAAEGFRAAEVLMERADRRRAAPYRIWARLLLARYAGQQGRTGEAITRLREADAILSSRRSATDAEMLGAVCRQQRRAVYESLVEFLAGERQVVAALTAAEKAKTLLIVDLLAGQDIGRDPAERELLKREAELDETIGRLQQRIMRVSDARSGAFLNHLETAEGGYRDLLVGIGEADPELLSLLSPRTIDPAALQRLLDPNTTLFDYFVTTQGLYVWAVHREQIRMEKINLTREALRVLTLSLIDAIQSRDRRKTRTLSRKAYDQLLKPIIPFVSGDRIGFIPDDILAYFPFAAMSYRGRYLADGFSIFHLPEAGLLERVTAGKGSAGLRILAFGNPDLVNESLDLRYAEQELERIRKQINRTTLLLREQASEAKAGSMMAGYDILHFAVRGQFLPDAPLDSGLLLTPGAGQDGTLSVLEIFRLRYPGRAVVLSGCDTLPAADPEGRGLVALQRAFLHAGSPSVISTLWLIEDRAASHLAEIFYRQLEKKDPLADALRAAQLHLLREGYPPHVWAAFVLTGGY